MQSRVTFWAIPIMSQPVLRVINLQVSNYWASVLYLMRYYHLINCFYSQLNFHVSFCLFYKLEKVFQPSMSHFNKIISFGIYSHSYLVLTTMPHFWMAAIRGLVQSPYGKISVIMTLGGGVLVHDVMQCAGLAKRGVANRTAVTLRGGGEGGGKKLMSQ